jgi:hypothetical protein
MAAKHSSGYSQFYQNVDVADSPDTTHIAAAGVWAPNGMTSPTLDLYDKIGAGKNLDAGWLEFIFTVNDAADADGNTAVFELYAATDNGPRQLVCTVALTGGTAQYTAGSDLTTWADTAVITDYRGFNSAANEAGMNLQAIPNDSGNNNVASVMVPVLGMRYWEGLFTGAGSTSVITTAYYRYFDRTLP